VKRFNLQCTNSKSRKISNTQIPISKQINDLGVVYLVLSIVCNLCIRICKLQGFRKAFSVLMIIMIALIFFPHLSWAATKTSDVKKGNLFFNQKKYTEALEKYNSALDKAPESPIINFDAGAARYKNGEYAKAIPYFQKSLLSDDLKLQAKAHYNLGNALYKAGIQKEDSALDSAIKSLEESLPHYEKSLSLQPEDEDSKFNDGFVKKELERLRKKQKNQSKKNKENSATQKNQESQSSHNTESSEQEKQKNPQQQNATSNDEKKPSSPPGEQKLNQLEPAPPGWEDDQEKQKGHSAPTTVKPAELSPQEARTLLDNYQQNEEPRGLLNMRWQRHSDSAPVLKDW